MICPHLIEPMSAFCRCAIDPERDHCAKYSELCHGNGWPCFADLGPWGAWRAFADHHMAVVFLTYWCARVNGWAWTEMQLYRILRDAVPQLAEPVGWSP